MPSSLVDLAIEISANAYKLEKLLAAQSLPQPSLSVGGIECFPPDLEIQKARGAVLEASDELRQLAMGPRDILMSKSFVDKYNVAVLRFISSYKVVHVVPLDRPISFEELSTKIGIDVDHTTRILRHGFTGGLFKEITPGHVSHTAVTAYLRKDRLLEAMVGHNMTDSYPASVKLNEALEQFGDSQAPDKTAFQVAFNTEKDFWKILEEDEQRRTQFHTAMDSLAQELGFSVQHVEKGFAWESLPEGSTVVDIGGSQGHVSIKLAQAFPQLKFIVEDLQEVVEQGQARLPADVQDRVSFYTHSFFEPQPIQADIYFLRLILHDWPDDYCVKILNNVAAGMEDGARILVLELVLPEAGILPPIQERMVRSMDLQMMVSLNARERTLADWKRLVESCDERLKFVGVTQPAGSTLSVIEIRFETGASEL